MRTSTKVRIIFLIAAVMSLWVTSAVATPVENFTAHLTGDEEVPPVETDAVGQALFQWDGSDVRFRLIVDEISNVTQAHIHCGARGANGPVVQFLFGAVPAGGGPVEGVLSSGSFDPSDKTCTLAEGEVSLLDAMRSGRTYANVHTDDGDPETRGGPGDTPTGEIRGQIAARG